MNLPTTTYNLQSGVTAGHVRLTWCSHKQVGIDAHNEYMPVSGRGITGAGRLPVSALAAMVADGRGRSWPGFFGIAKILAVRGCLVTWRRAGGFDSPYPANGLRVNFRFNDVSHAVINCIYAT